MTCAEFDQMFADAKGCCQICEIPGHATQRGYLVIDHDNAIGFHAARGLLCSSCNVFLGRSGHLNAGLILRYVQNAWHLTHREVVPIRVEVADIPRDEARPLLVAAAAACRDEASRSIRDQASRPALVDAIRIAAKAGWQLRHIREEIGGIWTIAQINGALHVKGCKVAGRIRTRDDDLVRAASQPPWRGQEFGQGFELHCGHLDGAEVRCGSIFYADGTWPMVRQCARDAGWHIDLECLDHCEKHDDCPATSESEAA